MLKAALAVSIGVLAVALFTTAAIGPAAMADAPKCKNKARGIKTNQESFKATEDNYTLSRQQERLHRKRK
jgi:hypothetical protein